MGMAASQARFLQLTARRTNCEYMGQQINQARTALANESAGLFEKLLALQVPTPPSSLDEKYFTQGYQFVDPTDEMRKKISWEGMEKAGEQVSNQDIIFTVHTQVPQKEPVLDALGNPTYTPKLDQNGNVITEFVFEQDGVTPVLDWAKDTNGNLLQRPQVDASGNPVLDASGNPVMEYYQVQKTQPVLEQVMKDVIKDIYTPHVTNMSFDTSNFADIPIDAISGLTPPTNADVSRTVVRYANIEHTVYDVDGNLSTYTKTAPMVMYFDNKERLLGFQELTLNAELIDDPTDPNYYNPGDATHGATTGNPAIETSHPPGLENFYLSAVAAEPLVKQCKELSYAGQFDECKYQEDMDKYEFDKAAYDYQIEQLNLKTKALQQQDKSLELKLKQIDTDHNAIQTEMEAVSKVITKNIETTFKTFA